MDFQQFFRYDFQQIPYVLVTLIIAFTIHEFAHAFVAFKFGDPTAKNQGRLTLNPLAHIDPIGALLILIAGFGWARPVPVNRFFFKNPRLAGVLVSIAGPVSNLILAIIGIILFSLIGLNSHSGIVINFLSEFIWLNVVLFVFNLIPLPPLDGYRIIEDLAPVDIRAKMTQYENYGVFIFLFLVITPLGKYTIDPIIINGSNAVLRFLSSIFTPFFG